MQPKILILIASFNGGKFLKEQLASILCQVDVDVNVIISDDNSTDDTIDVINAFSSVYGDKVSLVNRSENDVRKRGSFENFLSLTRLVDVQSYDFVAYADQDDIWLPTKLSYGVSQLSFHGASAFSSGFFILKGLNVDLTYINKRKRYVEFDFFFQSGGPGCTYILESSHFRYFQKFCAATDFDKFDIKYFDWLIYAYFRSNNFCWIISDSSHMLYRQHGSNVLGANAGVFALFKRLKMILSGEYISSCRAMLSLFSSNSKITVKDVLEFRNIFNLRRSFLESAFFWFYFKFFVRL